MAAHVGVSVVDVLEQAGERYLGAADPDRYRALLQQVGAADTFRVYDASEAYWDRLQAVLDFFFSSPERAVICAVLIERAGLRARPEGRGFLVRALAERRMQALIRVAVADGARWSGRPD